MSEEPRLREAWSERRASKLIRSLCLRFGSAGFPVASPPGARATDSGPRTKMSVRNGAAAVRVRPLGQFGRHEMQFSVPNAGLGGRRLGEFSHV